MYSEIREVTTELAALEKDGKFHRWAIVEPKFFNEATDPQCKYLDSLARLLATEKDTCISIFYDKKGKKLLVSSNRYEPTEYVKKILKILQEFINVDDNE